MRVHEIMTAPPQTCPRGMHLAEASRRMRAAGCGSLIVLGPDGRLAGIITDRDVRWLWPTRLTPGAFRSIR